MECGSAFAGAAQESMISKFRVPVGMAMPGYMMRCSGSY